MEDGEMGKERREGGNRFFLQKSETSLPLLIL